MMIDEFKDKMMQEIALDIDEMSLFDMLDNNEIDIERYISCVKQISKKKDELYNGRNC